jgi:predicted nuclease of restriction endonuclease-like RecB superfamily
MGPDLEQRTIIHRCPTLAKSISRRREPEPFVVGRHVMTPDFSFEKDGMKAYLEVVGFWTKDYLAKKVQKLKEVHANNMIVVLTRPRVAQGSRG